MTPSSKPEYPPLLAVGFHPMSLADIRVLCVDAFPLSQRRHMIMAGLEAVVNRFVSQEVTADIWVDGSFLTYKIDPDDVDIVVHIHNDNLATMDQDQREIVEWLDEDLKEEFHCDSYTFVEYPEGSPFYGEGQWDKAYWIKQYGFNRSESDYKGVAVVKVGGAV